MTHTLIRRLSLLLLLAAWAWSAQALTVGLAPAEDTNYAPPPAGQGSPLGSLVSGCLNALFDAGYIVTDADVSRTTPDSWGPSSYHLAEAREGAVDYEIAFYVEWLSSAFHKDVLLPAKVRYRLLDTLDERQLAEGSVLGPADSENSSTHQARSAMQVGASVAVPCVKILRSLAMGGQ
jgi:hypothetical protein